MPGLTADLISVDENLSLEASQIIHESDNIIAFDDCVVMKNMKIILVDNFAINLCSIW